MNGRFVLVTGTSRGIGRATALRLASAGMSVIASVHRALVATRPKARYHCGWEQKVVALLERFASARMRDAIVGAMLSL